MQTRFEYLRGMDKKRSPVALEELLFALTPLSQTGLGKIEVIVMTACSLVK